MSVILKELFLFFIIYAFLGWIIEVVYHVFTLKKFVNRGFLNGPVCPIYGYGAVIMLLVLDHVVDMPIYVFIVGAITASILEYVTGYVLERLFEVRWWDYSEMKYNIRGYVSLVFTILWGIASVILAELLHPLVLKFVGLFSLEVIDIFIVTTFIIISLDLLVTVISLLEFKKIVLGLKETKMEFTAKLEIIQENSKLVRLKDYLEEEEVIRVFESKMKKLLEDRPIRYRRTHRKFLKSYPNLVSGELGSKIQEIIGRKK